MAQWRYQADGGVYTLDAEDIRDLVSSGRLSRDTMIQEVGADRWTTVGNSPFRDDARHAAPPSSIAARKQRRLDLRDGRWRTALLLFLALGYAGYRWSQTRMSCSRNDVRKTAEELVHDNLLKLTSGTVSLMNIATVGSLDSGGVKCTADVEISGVTGAAATYRELQFSAEEREDKIYVFGRLTR